MTDQPIRPVTSEPTRIGFHLYDGNGDGWVRVYGSSAAAPWHRTDWTSNKPPYAAWPDIEAPVETSEPVGLDSPLDERVDALLQAWQAGTRLLKTLAHNNTRED